jgi:hypothetical protein
MNNLIVQINRLSTQLSINDQYRAAEYIIINHIAAGKMTSKTISKHGNLIKERGGFCKDSKITVLYAL